MIEPETLVIIEDEAAIRKLISNGYGHGVKVLEAEDGEHGVRLVAKSNPDVVLLDLGLPDIDGQDVVLKIREWSTVPIIVLSARGQESDKVLALDRGADDYVTKPFSFPELQARVRAAIRHSARGGEPEQPVFRTEALVVDLSARTVHVRGSEVRLTPNEFSLLAELVKHAGKVLTHKHLLETVWGPAFVDELHYLRVYMGQLRHKIEQDPSRPKLIRTETGVGYRLLTDG